MADPNLDEVNTVTTKKIMPGIVDNFFKSGPIMSYLKANRIKPFNGGAKIQENFLYRPMKGGAYPKGGQFDVTRSQTKAGLLFDMKYYEVNVTEFPEDIEVIMRTPQAVFDTVETDLGNAALTLSSILEIDIMRNGQNVGGVDRSLNINGFEEALNNGTTASWAGNVFPSYGEQARVDVNGALYPAGGNPLQAAPVVAANVAGAITNRVLEHSYDSCTIGNEHPKLGITTTRGMGYINENFMPMQKLPDTKDPVIGWPGLKFKDATIIQSNYAPGVDGINDPDLGNYNASAGETFLWLNPGGEDEKAYFRLHLSSSQKYQFGFTGFKVQQDGTQVCGQILAALNFTVRAPRLMRLLYGITS